MTVCIYSNQLCVPLQGEFFVSAYDEEKRSWGKSRLIPGVGTTSAYDELFVSCCAFSPCGKYFAACLSKELIIYSISDWRFLCSIEIERKGISVRFFPKSDIILIAEKSGHVKFFKFSGCNIEKVDHVLGHNSMLLEALVSEDEKFIITCDRDEKIRVTNYPNCYNIQCYCLGHKHFVCCMNFLESDKNILISSSGDGTIKFWKISTGEELATYTGNSQEICKTNFNDADFFSKVISFKIGKDQSLIAGLKHKSGSITLLKVTGNISLGINFNVLSVLKHISGLWDIAFWQNNLLLLLSDKTLPFKLCSLDNMEKSSSDTFKNISECLVLNWEVLSKIHKKKLDSLLLLFPWKKENYILDDHEENKKAKCI